MAGTVPSSRAALRRMASMLGLGAVFLAAAGAAAKTNVTTYHNDTLRTGWNSTEASLTPGVVTGGSFGLLHQVTLDDQVDAQPLVVTNLSIAGGTHDVVYVATESNSIYAIDAVSGTVLAQTNLGTPVSISQLPGGCNNNGNQVGVDSTPVIDAASKTLYVIAYVSGSGGVEFDLHALNLATLADRVPPVVVSAVQTLSNGSTTYSFTAAASRQRAALLEANGNVYAGFASFCDQSGDISRGWVLGWKTATLAPISQNELTNRRVSSADNFFLTSIWMSGFGIASGGAGNLFFVTGNSDYSGNSYVKANAVNLAESVIEMSPDLKSVVSYFSPTDAGGTVSELDQSDNDFGAGGVMLLPNQSGSAPLLAVAAGKFGTMYLMNRANLGGQNSAAVIGEYSVGGCWCGPSYFKGSDGLGRVVSSGGNTIHVWDVKTSPSTSLVADPGFAPPSVSSGQDGGFFTAVSSNGTIAGSAVIWALTRPVNSDPADIQLDAFDAGSGTKLFGATAGTWPNTGGNANLVPTVANGNVYVASYRSLDIFGATGSGAARPLPAHVRPPAPVSLYAGHQRFGIVSEIAGDRLAIETRDGKRIIVDTAEAVRKHAYVPGVVGHAVLARGDYDQAGVLHATALLHAKQSAALWQPDQ